MTERLLGGFEKGIGIARAPQGIGAHDPHLMRPHVTQPLTEAAQASERAFLARLIEMALLIEPGSEPHHLPQPVDDRRLPVVGTGDDHVEAIGSQVDSGHDLGRLVDGGLRLLDVGQRSRRLIG